MRDLTSAKWIVVKGILFLMLGMMSAALIIANAPSLRTAAVLVVTIWAFCRFYYFLFYVIERYVDPSFRYSGLGSAARYLIRKRARTREPEA